MGLVIKQYGNVFQIPCLAGWDNLRHRDELCVEIKGDKLVDARYGQPLIRVGTVLLAGWGPLSGESYVLRVGDSVGTVNVPKDLLDPFLAKFRTNLAGMEI